MQESKNFKWTTRKYETEKRKPKKEESCMLMTNMALVKVAPAECISEPGPSLVQYPARAKATPIRFKDFVMY